MLPHTFPKQIKTYRVCIIENKFYKTVRMIFQIIAVMIPRTRTQQGSSLLSPPPGQMHISLDGLPASILQRASVASVSKKMIQHIHITY